MTTTQHVDKKYGLHKFFANEVHWVQSWTLVVKNHWDRRNLKKKHGYIRTFEVTWTHFLHD